MKIIFCIFDAPYKRRNNKMNDSKNYKDSAALFRTVCISAVIILAVTVAVIGCIAVVSTRTENSHYISKSVIRTLFFVGLVVSLISSVTLPISFKRARIDFTSSQDPFYAAGRYLSLLPALFSLLVSAFAIFEGGELAEWRAAVILLALCTTLFFTLKSLGRRGAGVILSGFASFMLFAVIIISLYLDLSIEINSHFKLLVQFGAVGMMLGTMADIRLMLTPKGSDDNAELVRIRGFGFVALKSLSLILTAACASVVSICFAAGNTSLGNHYLVYSLLYLAYAISVICELVATAVWANKDSV